LSFFENHVFPSLLQKAICLAKQSFPGSNELRERRAFYLTNTADSTAVTLTSSI